LIIDRRIRACRGDGVIAGACVDLAENILVAAISAGRIANRITAYASASAGDGVVAVSCFNRADVADSKTPNTNSSDGVIADACVDCAAVGECLPEVSTSFADIRAPRKMRVSPASGLHKKMPFGIMAADYKYTTNANSTAD
jgi:hypothetical protein